MLYNEKNIKLLYFSPYIKMKVEDNKVIFYNYIFETIMEMEYKNSIIEKIKAGIELEELINLMNKYFVENETKEIINRLISYGVIE